jgi:uncharacterized protein YceH (UPF0502 family)
MTDTADAPVPPLLDPIQARVLACLVEKQALTPEVYPLTLNAVVTACNQKSSREPVMELEPGAVGHALRELEGKGFVAGSLSARASRYEHRFDRALGITPRQRAALCVLMLRGPQTLNEILTRCERLSDFPGPDEVQATLERLAQRAPALVLRLPRGGGQREDRYAHLLCGPVDVTALAAAAPAPTGGGAAARIDELERRVDELEQTLSRLLGKLGAEGD